MSIRTKEPEVPSKFPPACLFLDDVQQIVNILVELARTKAEQESQIAVTFSSEAEESDNIQDLPKLIGMKGALEIKIGANTWPNTALTFHRWFFSTWRSNGFSKENAWTAYHKLQPIFEKRKRRLNAIVHSLPPWAFPLCGIAASVVIELAAKLGRTSAVSALVLVIGGAVALARHTIVLPRNSWDSAPFWTYFKERLVPVLLGTGLGIFGTILGIYLKHKLWP